MPDIADKESIVDSANKWTIMFFFAGDNALSPHMISQLKAIKEAGFHFDANILVHFDPNEKGAPTRVFEINRKRKEKEIASSIQHSRPRKSQIGDGRDPFVRNYAEDHISPQELKALPGPVAQKLGDVLATKKDILTAAEALELFLDFCRERSVTEHYILFVVGHGLVVGNDTFLPDDNPPTGITLKEFAGILDLFAKGVRHKGGDFDLLALHSCSMSAIEVAYELSGTANFMMGTEGPSFVGSWPYRQLLKKTFNSIETANGDSTPVDISSLLFSLYNLSLHNGTDFLSAGYSSDLCLSKLQTKEVTKLNEPLSLLSKALKTAVRRPHERELILLAHLRSQSYWQESYCDLFDLCDWLVRLCVESNEEQQAIRGAGEKVKNLLDQNHSDALVVYSDYFGPAYQYSHGLSIYFPWTRPTDDNDDQTIANYKGYAFTTELGDDSWLAFLEEYWIQTRRPSREIEDNNKENNIASRLMDPAFGLATLVFEPNGVMSVLSDGKPNPLLSDGKPNPIVGETCSCPSIKNYPRDLSISSRALDAFK